MIESKITVDPVTGRTDELELVNDFMRILEEEVVDVYSCLKGIVWIKSEQDDSGVWEEEFRSSWEGGGEERWEKGWKGGRGKTKCSYMNA